MISIAELKKKYLGAPEATDEDMDTASTPTLQRAILDTALGYYNFEW